MTVSSLPHPSQCSHAKKSACCINQGGRLGALEGKGEFFSPYPSVNLSQQCSLAGASPRRRKKQAGKEGLGYGMHTIVTGSTPPATSLPLVPSLPCPIPTICTIYRQWWLLRISPLVAMLPQQAQCLPGSRIEVHGSAYFCKSIYDGNKVNPDRRKDWVVILE